MPCSAEEDSRPSRLSMLTHACEDTPCVGPKPEPRGVSDCSIACAEVGNTQHMWLFDAHSTCGFSTHPAGMRITVPTTHKDVTWLKKFPSYLHAALTCIWLHGSAHSSTVHRCPYIGPICVNCGLFTAPCRRQAVRATHHHGPGDKCRLALAAPAMGTTCRAGTVGTSLPRTRYIPDIHTCIYIDIVVKKLTGFCVLRPSCVIPPRGH